MLPPAIEHDLEDATVALNAWQYAESAGLPADPADAAAPAARLAALYAGLLDHPTELVRACAVENWAEARRLPLENQITAARDKLLQVPGLSCSEGGLTWRNWKAFEREARSAAELSAGFEQLVARSLDLAPLLQVRLEQARRDFGSHGLTPAHTFALREGSTVAGLQAFLQAAGRAARAPFAQALNRLSQAVLGRPAGPAELRALYLNRMYEPADGLFSASAETIHAALAAFTRCGFDLRGVPVDVVNRPRKYPGAFCFPVQVPGDVRVSVRIASAHHLVDMLYHELGHAAHFSGIRADLPFLDRYWIHSGTHETFSTLFEHLLAEPVFLEEQFGLGPAAVDQLLAFARLKLLLTATWLGAAGLTVLETWAEGLDWARVEQRYAAHMLDFTGVAMPPGFARLEPFTAALSIYPAGYVIAAARASHWVTHLRGIGGGAWWRSPAAQADIRARIAAGGQVVFPPAWDAPLALPVASSTGPL